jgi:hypothetical protein
MTPTTNQRFVADRQRASDQPSGEPLFHSAHRTVPRLTDPRVLRADNLVALVLAERPDRCLSRPRRHLCDLGGRTTPDRKSPAEDGLAGALNDPRQRRGIGAGRTPGGDARRAHRDLEHGSLPWGRPDSTPRGSGLPGVADNAGQSPAWAARRISRCGSLPRHGTRRSRLVHVLGFRGDPTEPPVGSRR